MGYCFLPNPNSLLRYRIWPQTLLGHELYQLNQIRLLQCCIGQQLEFVFQLEKILRPIIIWWCILIIYKVWKKMYFCLFETVRSFQIIYNCWGKGTFSIIFLLISMFYVGLYFIPNWIFKKLRSINYNQKIKNLDKIYWWNPIFYF